METRSMEHMFAKAKPKILETGEPKMGSKWPSQKQYLRLSLRYSVCLKWDANE